MNPGMTHLGISDEKAMGTCSSIHKSKMPLAPSPKKQKNANGNGGEKPVQMVEQWLKFQDIRVCKGEMFFDSRPWLDSDCEDDFLSINGDFTPSRGRSPNNQRSFSFNNFPGSDSEPSPTVRKKLADLFQETSQLDTSGWDEVETNTKHGLLSGAETDQPWNGASKSSRSRDIKENQKAAVLLALSISRGKEDQKVEQCCLPSLIPSYIFSSF